MIAKDDVLQHQDRFYSHGESVASTSSSPYGRSGKRKLGQNFITEQPVSKAVSTGDFSSFGDSSLPPQMVQVLTEKFHQLPTEEERNQFLLLLKEQLNKSRQ